MRMMAFLLMLVSLEGCFWVVHDFDGYPHGHGYGPGHRHDGRGGDV
jgi:hypothetical protein